MKAMHRYTAVTSCNRTSRAYARYTDACAWLDRQEPQHAIRGFALKYVGADMGVHHYSVRHAR